MVGGLLTLLSFGVETSCACAGRVRSGGASGFPLVLDLLDVAEIDLRVLSATGDVNPLLCSVRDIQVALQTICM